ncbi:hypothetical protein RV14_GL001863 [Enterococcus ratti]|uniref:Uncharacterized protein n=1 Tax=Enterococcus ratti TaxID=150033 RepID=A0A1L8WQ66_9ENTE|nr:hypothetical protein RV14_GL001863 [Enterococcus ratti]
MKHTKTKVFSSKEVASAPAFYLCLEREVKVLFTSRSF